MQTAQDPVTGNRGRVRFKDNGGNCVQVTIENVSGSKAQVQNTSTGGHLLVAAGKVYRILASKYRFEIFTPGASPVREYVCAGILWIPSPYQGIITEAIYMQGNGDGDSSTQSPKNCFRNSFSSGQGSTGQSNTAFILNGSLLDGNGNFYSSSGALLLIVSVSGHWTGYQLGASYVMNGYRWHDLAVMQSDPLMASAIVSYTDEALVRGQVYDWTILSEFFPIDSIDSWIDGGSNHNFFCMMGFAGDQNNPRGSIWVAYS
jgi:hypothetical protein